MTRSEMTSRERMLVAMQNGIPDRVPVAPDISFMVPTRLTGKDFFAVVIEEDPPLWQAYLDAVDYFGMDGWFIYGNVEFETEGVEVTRRWEQLGGDKRIEKITYHTRAGDLTEDILHTRENPPVWIKKRVEDVEKDWPAYLCLFGEIASADHSRLKQQRAELGDRGVLGLLTGSPGLPLWHEHFEGGLEELAYLTMDDPAKLNELCEQHSDRLMRELEYLVRADGDFVLVGASGSITLASPKLWLKYSLETLKQQCELCAARGVPIMLHSCGKEKFVVETCARETSVNCINPLEIAPMGDMTLAEAKKIVKGTNLALMGNLHTTSVMLHGTAEQVRAAARQAIKDAGEGGGFILSTGDQCGWDTPDENIFAMVETAKMYGRYDYD